MSAAQYTTRPTRRGPRSARRAVADAVPHRRSAFAPSGGIGAHNLDTQAVKVPYNRRMKKSYTASFKAQAVLELLKETKTLNQLAAELEVAASMETGCPAGPSRPV